jgi:hypothetical protein
MRRRGLASSGVLARGVLARGVLARAVLARAVLAGAFVVGSLTTTRPADAAPDADLVAALEAAGGADVVSIDLPATPHAPRVRAVSVARAPAATVLAVLGDPSRYAALIPSLVRAEEIGRRGDVRVVKWELEVPLFNLSGTLEVRPHGSGVELALVDGDFSPGHVVFEVAPRADGRTTVQLDARLDITRSSFFLRRLMARSDYGEPAALSAAAWVALRATVLRAEHPRDATAFRPTAAPPASTPGRPDGGVLAQAACAPLAARGAAALVRVAPSGRLAGISVAVAAREPTAGLAARLADPRSWRAFPGWHSVQPTSPTTVVVEDSIPFVDLDATWRDEPGPGARWWTAVEGASRGAWFGWEVFPPLPISGPASSLAVLTMVPRLETTGSIPRRFIEAEPLLEHGMSLALAFVDAVSATRGGAR